MSDKPEVRITPKQLQVYELICEYHAQTNGRVPMLKEIASGMGFAHMPTASSYVKKLVEKGLLRRFEKGRGYYLPEDRPAFTVSNYTPRDRGQDDTNGEARQQTTANDSQPGITQPADEFQYIRLGIGEAATIGDVYIGLVYVETDKEVAALEVIAPASMGTLRRDVQGEDGQPPQPGQYEILLRCMEKTIELMATEIYRLKKAGTQPAGRREA